MSGLVVTEASTILVVAETASSPGATLVVDGDTVALIADGERGPRGATGEKGRDGVDSDGATDPGDLTLLFNNRLI